jgi:hypothetical protein
VTRALWELHLRSLRGRLIRWFRLFRQPKYLLGLIVGGAWILFWAGRPILKTLAEIREDKGEDFNIRFGVGEVFSRLPEGTMDGIQLAVAVGLTAMIAGWWLWPWGKAVIKLTEAELNTLLPAPLSRRQVIQYGLLKNQPGILFGAAIMSVILPSGGLLRRLAFYVTIWLFFTLWDFHSAVRNLWLARLRELPPVRAARQRLVVIGLIAAYLLAIGVAVMRAHEIAWPQSLGRFEPGMEALPAYAEGFAGAANQGWLQVLLSPALVLLAPFFVSGTGTRLLAFLIPVAFLAIHHEMAVRFRSRFEDAVVERAHRDATKKTPGSRVSRRPLRVRRRQPFRLASSGAPEVAIYWKNLMQIQRLGLGRTVVMGLGILAVVAALPTILGLEEIVHPILAGVGVIIFFGAPLIAPLALRNDLRMDLLQTEQIRPWPVATWRLVLAEALGPATFSVLWTLFGAGVILAAALGSILLAARTGSGPAGQFLFSGWGSAIGTSDLVALLMLLLGALPLAAAAASLSSAVQNLAVLLFPGWIRLGRERSKGPAAFGQNLIVAWVLMLALAIGMLPGLLVVGGILLAHGLMEISVVAWEVPLLGILAALPLALETGLVVWGAGRLWQRLDPSGEILGEA